MSVLHNVAVIKILATHTCSLTENLGILPKTIGKSKRGSLILSSFMPSCRSEVPIIHKTYMKNMDVKTNAVLFFFSLSNFSFSLPSKSQLHARAIEETLIMNSDVDNPMTKRNTDAR